MQVKESCHTSLISSQPRPLSMAATSTSAPEFRLLLHGQDGAIPYLTPELMRLVFGPDGDNGWQWRREHIVLGVAAKDTAVKAVYRDASSTPSKKKRKKEARDSGGGTESRPGKRARSEAAGALATAAAVEATAAKPVDGKGQCKQQSNGSGSSNAKKPSGYTFLAPSDAAKMCAATAVSSLGDADTGEQRERLDAAGNSFLHTHLRIPPYIPTIIVPMFSLDVSADDRTHSNKNAEARNKHAPKKQQHPSRHKAKAPPKNGAVVPSSTKNTMPVDTPHGWQRLTPERYWDAVVALTRPTSPASCAGTSSCLGAVGLFDRRGFPREPPDPRSEARHADADEDARGGDAVAPEMPGSNGQASLRRLVQRTDDWSRRVRLERERSADGERRNVEFWTPVHLASSFLTSRTEATHKACDPVACVSSHVIPDGAASNEGTDVGRMDGAMPSHVAIVDWDAIGHDRERRRRALTRLVAAARPAPSPPSRQARSLVLAVGDLFSVLDAALCGVSIIGTDLVRRWSLEGVALCLDLEPDNSDAKDGAPGAGASSGGLLDVTDERYARDWRPLLPGCTCLACRPRRTIAFHPSFFDDGSRARTVPSFTRAYVHHLIKSREMLAQCLLFAHNLHQMLLLFRRLSEAAAADREDREKSGDGARGEGYLPALCRRVEAILG